MILYHESAIQFEHVGVMEIDVGGLAVRQMQKCRSAKKNRTGEHRRWNSQKISGLPNILPGVDGEVREFLVASYASTRQVLLENECYEHDQHEVMFALHVGSDTLVRDRSFGTFAAIVLIAVVGRYAVVFRGYEGVGHHDQPRRFPATGRADEQHPLQKGEAEIGVFGP